MKKKHSKLGIERYFLNRINGIYKKIHQQTVVKH